MFVFGSFLCGKFTAHTLFYVKYYKRFINIRSKNHETIVHPKDNPKHDYSITKAIVCIHNIFSVIKNYGYLQNTNTKSRNHQKYLKLFHVYRLLQKLTELCAHNEITRSNILRQ